MTLGKLASVEAARSQSPHPGLPGRGHSQALLMRLGRVTTSWPALEVGATMSGALCYTATPTCPDHQFLWPLGLDPHGLCVHQGPRAPHP